MSLGNHIKKLETDHRELDDKIQAMESSGRFDDGALRALKKKKLRIRDEIEVLRKTKTSVSKLRSA